MYILTSFLMPKLIFLSHCLIATASISQIPGVNPCLSANTPPPPCTVTVKPLWLLKQFNVISEKVASSSPSSELGSIFSLGTVWKRWGKWSLPKIWNLRDGGNLRSTRTIAFFIRLFRFTISINRFFKSLALLFGKGWWKKEQCQRS